MKANQQRIIGYDFARGLAILGMIIVNFKTVMAMQSATPLYKALDFLSGKAAALFIILAGVGMSIMYQKAKNSPIHIQQVKTVLLKRSLFLLVVGMSYYFLWPADILHYYAFYISIGLFFLNVHHTYLQIVSLLLIFTYPVLLFFFDYETGWDWHTLTYTDFFTIQGFFRNLLFNGFHPILPWSAFLLIGIWLGRLNLRDKQVRLQLELTSLLVFIVFQSISSLLISNFSKSAHVAPEDLKAIIGTSPMPPLIFYMLTASAASIFVITVSIWFTEKFPKLLPTQLLVDTGRLALSNYFFHIVIGMLTIEVSLGRLERAFSVQFSFYYALFFSSLTIVFSHFWSRKFKQGPLEYLMRKITG